MAAIEQGHIEISSPREVAFAFLSFMEAMAEMNLSIFWWALFAVEVSVSLVCYHRLPLQSIKTGAFKGHCF